MNEKILGMLAFTLLGTATAYADDSGFYLGGSVGEATAFGGKDASFRLLGGYSINENFAFEAGYVSGGKIENSSGSLHYSFESDGFFASALAKLPLGDVVTPYAKFGYVIYDSTATVSNGTATAAESEGGSRILFGAGVELRVRESLRLRVDYEKVRVPDMAFDIYSLVATWHF